MHLPLFLLLLLIVCTTPIDIIDTSEDPRYAEALAHYTGDMICHGLRSWCPNCLSRNKFDLKKCISYDLDKKKSDRRLLPDFGRKLYDAKAEAAVNLTDRQVVLAVNVNSCKMVQWTTIIGPLDVGNRRVPDATVRLIVDQLQAVDPKSAAELVLKNAYHGRDEVKAFLNTASPLQQFPTNLTLADDLERRLKNTTIQFLDVVIFRAAGGPAAALSITLWAHRSFGNVEPSYEEGVLWGALGTSVLLIYLWTIDWLEREILEKPLLVEAGTWVYWIIQTSISRLRRLVSKLPKLPPQLRREAIISLLESWGRSGVDVVNDQLELADAVTASANDPRVCDSPVGDNHSQ